MLIPIRCFTCGKTIAHVYEEFVKRTREGSEQEDPKEVLDDLGIKRICCRRMLVTHVNLVDDIINFY
ncbi:MAG: DNA-directed RNA polymerase subunit N [Candidatus Kariarchaeaceae archaeon]